MAPGNYTPPTRLMGEVITATKYNDDHATHWTNLTPSGIDDLSPSVGAMQATMHPGAVGSEVLPTSMAQEIQQLRHVIGQLGDGTQWYAPSPPQQLTPPRFGAVGDGVTDDTTAFQEALDSLTGPYAHLDLDGRHYAITSIAVPNATKLLVTNGVITVTGPNLGFVKTTTTSPQAPGGVYAQYDLTFDHVHFIRSTTGGACIYCHLAWQDLTGGIIVQPTCSFTLTNGAVGVNLGRCGFNRIAGRFRMDGGNPGTSIGLLANASDPNTLIPGGPFTTTVTAIFEGGIGFDQLTPPGGPWNSFEGFIFAPGCSFYVSEFRAKLFNSLTLQGCHMVNAKSVIDSGFNTVISGCYFDRNDVSHGPLLTVKTTARNHQGMVITGGNVFTAQGTAGNLIHFTDAGALGGTQLTNVVIGDNYFVGGVNALATPIQGIHFDYAGMRNINFTGGSSFQNMYSALQFGEVVNRSVFKAFDARDITHYAEGVVIGYGTGQFNRFDGIYKVLTVRMFTPTFETSPTDDPIVAQLLTFDSMMRAPTFAITNMVSDPAGFFTLEVPTSYRDGIEVVMVKLAGAAPAGRGIVTATITLNAGAYIAPL